MSSPAVNKAPPKLGSKAGTPSKIRSGSGSSAASKPSVTDSPKSTRKTPARKLTPKEPEPIHDDLDDQSIPETPSPKSQKKASSSEQRRPASPPDEAASQVSGSAVPLGGAASSLGKKAKGLAGQAKDTTLKGAKAVSDFIPIDLSALKGLQIADGGKIFGQNESPIGEVVEGDPEDLVGQTVGDDGEIVDEEGDLIGRVDVLNDAVDQAQNLPDDAQSKLDEAKDVVTDLAELEGLPVSDGGVIKNAAGQVVGKIVEGEPEDLIGYTLNDEGEIVDEDGDAIGRAELIPVEEQQKAIEEAVGDATDKANGVKDEVDESLEDATDGLPDNEATEAVEGATGKAQDAVDEDGEITDKYGNVKGRAEPYEQPEEEAPVEDDLSILEGKVVNKTGNVVDPSTGAVLGRIVEGDKRLAGRKVDGKGQIWGDNGQVIGRAELIPGAEQQKAEGAFYGFENAEVGKDGVVVDHDRIIGRLIEGDAKRLLGRKVDEDGDVVDKNGNTIGKAERWEPEEKPRDVNPMSGRKVTKEGEVRDADGNLIGKLTSGNLATLVGKAIDDNGFVVDNDGNKIGECTLVENIPEPEEEGPSPEEQETQAKAEHDRQLAEKMCYILRQTLDQIKPVCKQITDHLEKADRTPKEELDEEKVVQNVKPLLEEGGRILQECNGSIRALDPDGRIAATAKARASSRDATPEEYQLADMLKELTETVVKTIDNGRKRIADMPHAKKKLNPLWSLLSEPLFQIIAAVGLLLSGVLGLVGRLLDGLGLGGILNGLLGGLGLDKLISGLGLGGLTDALGLGGNK